MVAPGSQWGFDPGEPCRGANCQAHDHLHECFAGGTDGTLRCIYPLDYDHEAAERWDEWRRSIPYDHPQHPWAQLTELMVRVLRRHYAEQAAAAKADGGAPGVESPPDC